MMMLKSDNSVDQPVVCPATLQSALVVLVTLITAGPVSVQADTPPKAVISKETAEDYTAGDPLDRCYNAEYEIPFVACDKCEQALCWIGDPWLADSQNPDPNQPQGPGNPGPPFWGPGKPGPKFWGPGFSSTGRPPSAPTFSSGSVIDNYTFGYAHAAMDYHSGGTSSAGCSTCSGGTSGGRSGNPWSDLVLTRIFRSRDMTWIGSFGPGVFSNLDIKLEFLEQINGSVTIFDPLQVYPRRLTTGQNGTYVDASKSIRSLAIFDNQGNSVSDIASAETAVLTTPGGQQFIFEIVQANPDYNSNEVPDPTDVPTTGSPVGQVRDGRLIRYEDENGRGVTITYKMWTEAELQASPERQWQIDTVTTDTGLIAGFTYNAQQIGGRWVVSSISLPDGNSLTYTYTADRLTAVTLPDGSQATFTYGQNPTTLATTVAIYDPMATDGHRQKTVYLTGHGNGNPDDDHILSSASGLVRLVLNGSDEVTYLNTAQNGGAVAGAQNIIYEGAGKAKLISSTMDHVRYFQDGWEFTQNASGFSESFVGDTDDGITYHFDSFLQQDGRPDAITNEQGIRRDFEYDPIAARVTKVIWGDQTFETYAYNSLGRAIRHRDRMGRVTKATYDADGRPLTLETGILEVQSTAGGGATAYDNGYNAGYDDAYDDGYNMLAYADYSNTGDVDYDQGYVDGYSDGFYDGENDGWMAMYQGDYWMTSHGSSHNYTGGPPVIEDQNQPEHAISRWEYYAAGHPNQGQLKTAYDPLWDGSSTDTHRTDNEYDASGNLIRQLGPASTSGGTRPETLWTYDTLHRVATMTDPAGHQTSYEYDSLSRLVRTTYDDGTTEETLYGAPGSGNEGLIVATKNRRNVVTETSYDNAGRKILVTVATAWDSNILDGNPHDTPITDRNEQSITTYTYEVGTQQVAAVTRDGAKTDYVTDYRGRIIETKTYPNAGKTLTAKSKYVDNRKLWDEDPYGRRTWYAYRASDGAMVRILKDAYPGEISDAIGESGPAIPPEQASYNAGYDLGYYEGYDDGYNYNWGGGTSSTGAPDYDQGYEHGHNAGFPDGEMDATFGEPYHGTYWMGAYGIGHVYGMNDNSDIDYNASLLALVRDQNLNPPYVIKDMVQDVGGNQIQIIDERGIRHDTEVDTRGRTVRETKAVGTAVEAITETDYDAAGNVIEIRTPRYFDSNDTHGYEKCRTVMTYDGANRLASRTEAPGTPEAGTESYTYDTSGRQISRTDARGKVWATTYAACCGHSTASINPLGHGSISNRNAEGLVVHTAGVADVGSHTSLLNPDDDKTLREVTTRYDALGRSIASCTWLTPQGIIEADNPPLAGFDGISGDDGLTTQTLYDVNLADGIGLDSAEGVTVTNPLGGTFTVTLTASLVKLAEPIEHGGAGITFDATAPGSATVSLNAENEVTFSIADARGRSAMSGIQHPHDALGGATLGDLITWNCQIHDTTEQLTDGETVLASVRVNALGHTTKSRSNGLGHVLETVGQGGFLSKVQHDAAGNVVVSRDPNNVGFDAVYGELNRLISQTDTAGSQTQTVYDKAGQTISEIDAKGNNTLHVYDTRGRKILTTNRIGGTNQFTYDASGNQLSITDAESQVTSYEYDDRNLKVKTTYPDHVPGSAVGMDGYGITECSYDSLNRRNVCSDQAGDTITFGYDMAGRVLSRDYRTVANSPSGIIADTDSFTYDAASRMLTATSGRYSNVCSMTYNDTGRKTSESLNVGGQTYTTSVAYDKAGRQIQITYPDGTVLDQTYTDRSQLQQLIWDGNVVDSRTYDDGSRLQTCALGNGITETHSYNADNTLNSISFSNADLGSYSYTWDENKNKTSETITGPLAGYSFTTAANGYDNEDRLTTYDRTDLNQQWNLSLEGDWNTFTENGVLQNRTHGPAHEIKTIGTPHVTHDVKGNVTSKPSSLNSADISTLTWDLDNRLTSVDTDNDGTVNVQYTYDAMGRRVTKNNTVFVCNGQQVMAEYQLGTGTALPTEQYVYGTYLDEPVVKDGTGGLLYYHRNQQYSVTALTDAAGSVVEYYAYDAHGNVAILDATVTGIADSAIANTYSYTGRRYESETGDYYFRARYYNSELGRFLGRDPLEYVDGRHLYATYMNLRYTDAHGMCVECIEGEEDPTAKRTVSGQGVLGNTSGSTPSQFDGLDSWLADANLWETIVEITSTGGGSLAEALADATLSVVKENAEDEYDDGWREKLLANWTKMNRLDNNTHVNFFVSVTSRCCVFDFRGLSGFFGRRSGEYEETTKPYKCRPDKPILNPFRPGLSGNPRRLRDAILSYNRFLQKGLKKCKEEAKRNFACNAKELGI